MPADTQRPAAQESSARLRVTDTIGDLLNHPAFARCGRLLLPWDERPYDKTMRLGDIGQLLPYHTCVDSDVVVSSINRMIDDAHAGKPIFYDVYTEAEKAAERGYNAFVLKYRAGLGAGIATADLAVSTSYVFRNADSLGVGIAGYSLWGSSAGARMAAAIGSYGTATLGGADLPKPSTVVMAYTGHSDIAVVEPPTFVVAGEGDRIAPPTVMERRVAALRNASTKVEYHKYSGVGHGFGLGIGASAEGWSADAVRFWEHQIA
jgi:acetyl esterase/lipase